jgi:peroxiredoxin Q/BCP
MANLKPGDKAPGFALRDQENRPVSLADFRGRHLLVYFYPAADTPGCTKQSCAVRDASGDLAKAGLAAVGISPDEPAKQQAFDTKYRLGFPLLSDPDHRTAAAWGAWGGKSMWGKTYEGVIRSAFLVDGDGRIVEAWYKVKPDQTVPNVLEAAKIAKG